MRAERVNPESQNFKLNNIIKIKQFTTCILLFKRLLVVNYLINNYIKCILKFLKRLVMEFQKNKILMCSRRARRSAGDPLLVIAVPSTFTVICACRESDQHANMVTIKFTFSYTFELFFLKNKLLPTQNNFLNKVSLEK